MELALGYILLAFICSMLFAPILINYLYKNDIVRKQYKDFSAVIGERYLKVGTPIMGGLLVIIITVILTIIFNLNSSTIIPIIVMLIAGLLGGIDDYLNIHGKKRIIRTVEKQLMLSKVHKSFFKRLYYILTLPWTWYMNVWYSLGSYPGTGIHAGEKILIQIVSGGIVAWWIYFQKGIEIVNVPYFGDFTLGWVMIPFIIFAVVSTSNAVNISDGMDGLSTGLMLPSFTAFLYFAALDKNIPIVILLSVIIGALIAYLYFNIKPARIEMGDVGTLALGTILAAIAFELNRPLLLPIIGFMFVIEIGSSLVQGIFRKVFGRRLLKMAPLHLHYQIKGWTEEKTVMRFTLFAVLFAILGIWLGLVLS